jgi:hypothetical protein
VCNAVTARRKNVRRAAQIGATEALIGCDQEVAAGGAKLIGAASNSPFAPVVATIAH